MRPARRGMQRPEPCGGERLRPSTGGFVASDRLGRARAFHVGPLPHGCSPEVRAVRGFSLIGRAGWRGPCGNDRPAVMRSSESGISEPGKAPPRDKFRRVTVSGTRISTIFRYFADHYRLTGPYGEQAQYPTVASRGGGFGRFRSDQPVLFRSAVQRTDRKSTRLNSSHDRQSRMPSSA